ncbi:hypothetical protein Trydic_g8237 [Trypoxylus dichotomus]
MWKTATIVLTGGLCYFNSLFGTLVFDDTEAILKNRDVLPSTPLINVFRNDFWGTDVSLNISHKSYRPVTILSYRLNIFLSDSVILPFHFHLTNVVLYIILCGLVYPMLKMFIKTPKWKADVPFLSTLLFTVHPVHTEVISGLVGRADLLYSILSIISLLLYERLIKNNSLILFITIYLLIAVAVLCKETAIMALGLCSVYDVFQTKFAQNKFNAKFIYRNLGLMAAGITILYFRFWIMNFEGPIFAKNDNPAAFADHILTRILTYNYIYFLNVLLLIWPQWLCFDWSMGCIPLIDNLCDTRILSLVYDTSSTTNALALSLTILPFVPASNIFFKVGFVIAERALLLPSAGYCLLIVLGIKKLQNRFYIKEHIWYRCFYLTCAIFAIRTIQRNFEWLNEETLFKSALDVCPRNAKVHYNIAKIAADSNNKQMALYEYRKAIELNPEYEQAMNNLANLLREGKRFEEAEILLRKALKIRPNFAAAWMNLGIVLTNLNRSKEAEECYLKAIHFRNKYPDCYYNLGNLYLDMDRVNEALKAWEKAVHYKPTHTAAWSNTLVLLDSLQLYENALELGKIALMYNPRSPALHFSIANTLGKLQQFDKAEKHFLEAINFSPQNALYHSNLGVLYHRWGKLDMAREMYKKALQLDSRMKTTEQNLKKLLYAQQNTTQ